MATDDLVKILGGLGLSAGAGAIVSALITSYSGKGKARAEAADLLVSAAERVGLLNKEMDAELREVKQLLDEVFILLFRYLAEEISKEELLESIKTIRNDR